MRCCPRCGEDRLAGAASSSDRWICPDCGAMLKISRGRAALILIAAAVAVAVTGYVLSLGGIRTPWLPIVFVLMLGSWLFVPRYVTIAHGYDGLYCPRCGHDVRAQVVSSTSDCPECGATLPPRLAPGEAAPDVA